MEVQFDEEDDIFLVVLNPQPLGVLGIRVNGEHGTMRMYEPPVREGYEHVGEALIAEGIRRAVLRGVKKLRTSLRFPYDAPIPWQAKLFRDMGFLDGHERRVQLIANLNSLQPKPADIETTACDSWIGFATIPNRGSSVSSSPTEITRIQLPRTISTNSSTNGELCIPCLRTTYFNDGLCARSP